MTDAKQLTKLYVFAVSLLVFLVAWAVVAARPWVTKPSTAAAVARLAAREQRIQVQSLVLQQLRKTQRAQRQLAAAAPAPAPRIVTLPPLTITRTS